MRTRHWAAIAAVVSLGLAACGGDDGGGPLSESEFADQLSDICGDAQRDLGRLDLPTDDDVSAFSADAAEILNGAIEELQALAPPENAANDLEDFIGVLEDQLRAVEDLADANGSDERDAAFEDLAAATERQGEIAQDLDVPKCGGNDSGSDTTTTEAAAATTVPATVPVTTAAPITLPPTVAPTVPETTAAATVPPATTANFAVVDLTTIFVAPAGFFLSSGTPDQPTIDLIASLPEMNEKLLEIGVATLVESGTNREIADIWVGISRTPNMPADWKNIDCPDGGELRTSANGVPGIVCYGALESPVWEIFTATVQDYGISVYTLVPDVPSDLVVDAFLAANP